VTEHPEPLPELHADEPLHRPLIGLLVAVAVATVLGVALVGLPREGARLPAIARQALAVALPQWHTTEPVSEVVYGTRAMDTFGETFLLLAAVVSVVLLCRAREPRRGFIGEERAGEEEQREDDPHPGADQSERAARNADEAEAEDDPDPAPPPDQAPLGTPAPERAHEMSVVTRTATRVAAPVLAIAGIYLVAEGYSPGGGFPAGGVALGVILLLYAGFGYRRIAHGVNPGGFEIAELAGALAIIGIELLGLIINGSFTANWIHLAPRQTLRSGGVLQAFSVTEFVEVGTGLVIVVFSLIGIRRDWVIDEADDDHNNRMSPP
jgi:multicomponent Na+:H+ antiporter subunit B